MRIPAIAAHLHFKLTVRFLLIRKKIPQNSHTYGISLVCIVIWLLSCCFYYTVFYHIHDIWLCFHRNGFVDDTVSAWKILTLWKISTCSRDRIGDTFSIYLWLQRYPQIWHLKSLPFICIFAWSSSSSRLGQIWSQILHCFIHSNRSCLLKCNYWSECVWKFIVKLIISTSLHVSNVYLETSGQFHFVATNVAFESVPFYMRSHVVVKLAAVRYWDSTDFTIFWQQYFCIGMTL